MNKTAIVTVSGFFFMMNVNAQSQLTVEQTLDLAIENNASLKAYNLQIEKSDAFVGSAFSFDKTALYYNYDESNLAINNEPLKVFGVSQDFKFPTVYFAEKKVNKEMVNLEESKYNIQFQHVKKRVYSSYYQLSYVKQKAETYRFLDSLYQDFAKKAARRFELGETNYLETITAESKQKQLETLYKQALQDVEFSKEQLKAIVQVDTLNIIDQDLEKLELQSPALQDNSGLQYFENAKNYQNAVYQSEKQNLLPDLNFEYFQGTNDQLNSNIKGYQFGIKIPLLFFGNSSKIKASKIAKDIISEQKQDYEVQLNSEYKSLLTTLNKYEEAVNYYNTQGERLKDEIIKTANRTFKEGEIDFFQYIQSLETAKDIELTYLDNLNAYNQTVININNLILKIY